LKSLGIENASTLRRQEIYFAILKKLAEKGEEITGGGVLQLLQDGFSFLRDNGVKLFTRKKGYICKPNV
jgi:Transcription termination factor